MYLRCRKQYFHLRVLAQTSVLCTLVQNKYYTMVFFIFEIYIILVFAAAVILGCPIVYWNLYKNKLFQTAMLFLLHRPTRFVFLWNYIDKSEWKCCAYINMPYNRKFVKKTSLWRFGYGSRSYLLILMQRSPSLSILAGMARQHYLIETAVSASTLFTWNSC